MSTPIKLDRAKVLKERVVYRQPEVAPAPRAFRVAMDHQMDNRLLDLQMNAVRTSKQTEDEDDKSVPLPPPRRATVVPRRISEFEGMISNSGIAGASGAGGQISQHRSETVLQIETKRGGLIPSEPLVRVSQVAVPAQALPSAPTLDPFESQPLQQQQVHQISTEATIATSISPQELSSQTEPSSSVLDAIPAQAVPSAPPEIDYSVLWTPRQPPSPPPQQQLSFPQREAFVTESLDLDLFIDKTVRPSQQQQQQQQQQPLPPPPPQTATSTETAKEIELKNELAKLKAELDLAKQSAVPDIPLSEQQTQYVKTMAFGEGMIKIWFENPQRQVTVRSSIENKRYHLWKHPLLNGVPIDVRLKAGSQFIICLQIDEVALSKGITHLCIESMSFRDGATIELQGSDLVCEYKTASRCGGLSGTESAFMFRPDLHKSRTLHSSDIIDIKCSLWSLTNTRKQYGQGVRAPYSKMMRHAGTPWPLVVSSGQNGLGTAKIGAFDTAFDSIGSSAGAAAAAAPVQQQLTKPEIVVHSASRSISMDMSMLMSQRSTQTSSTSSVTSSAVISAATETKHPVLFSVPQGTSRFQEQSRFATILPAAQLPQPQRPQMHQVQKQEPLQNLHKPQIPTRHAVRQMIPACKTEADQLHFTLIQTVQIAPFRLSNTNSQAENEEYEQQNKHLQAHEAFLLSCDEIAKQRLECVKTHGALVKTMASSLQ